jgi:hypothetical protein
MHIPHLVFSAPFLLSTSYAGREEINSLYVITSRTSRLLFFGKPRNSNYNKRYTNTLYNLLIIFNLIKNKIKNNLINQARV